MGTIRFRGVISPASSVAHTEPVGQAIGFTAHPRENYTPHLDGEHTFVSHTGELENRKSGGCRGAVLPGVDEIRARKAELSRELTELERMEIAHSGAESWTPRKMRASRSLEDMLEDMMESAIFVSMDPPDTWGPYLKDKDMAGIIEMESKELVDALKKHAPAADVRREIAHTLAAMLRASL